MSKTRGLLIPRGLNWSFSTSAINKDCAAIKSPVAKENCLFFTGLDGVIYSLDAASGCVIWKRKLGAASSTSMAIGDKTLYVGTTDHHIYRLNAETGTVVAELTLEAAPIGRLTFAATMAAA